MKREEQIIEEAGKDSEIFYKVNDNYGDCFHGGFIAGAKWADEHPQFDKEAFMEKACEWLISSFAHLHNEYGFKLEFGNQDVFIEAFKKAMEE